MSRPESKFRADFAAFVVKSLLGRVETLPAASFEAPVGLLGLSRADEKPPPPSNIFTREISSTCPNDTNQDFKGANAFCMRLRVSARTSAWRSYKQRSSVGIYIARPGCCCNDALPPPPGRALLLL